MAQYGNVNDTAGYEEAFYNAYQAGYKEILQEGGDVYAGKTMVDTLEGEHKAYDWVGTVELSEKTTKFEDVPVDEIDHNRRWNSPRKFEKAVFVDDYHKIALLADPTSSYMRALIKGGLRKKNDVIYAAFEGTVQGGTEYGDDSYAFNDSAYSNTSEGGRTIPHDTTEKVVAAGGTSSGLTIEKLILARQCLVERFNDPNQIFNIVCTQQQISDLFREAVTQSLDTSPFRSLAEGKMMRYHGFDFIVDWNITLGSSNDIDADTNIYPCYAFTNEALLYGQFEAPQVRIDWLPRKQIWQVYAKMVCNAIRMDEDQVIKIECAAV